MITELFTGFMQRAEDLKHLSAAQEEGFSKELLVSHIHILPY